MPLETVDKNHLVYKKCFVKQSLTCKKNKENYRAWHDGKGFKGRHITVCFVGENHPQALPSVTVEYADRQPYIQVRKDFMARYTKPQKKVFLAHEWIHAMMILDGTADVLKTQEYNKKKMVLLHSLATEQDNWLGIDSSTVSWGNRGIRASRYRNPWADGEELLAKMHTALRKLLVSELSVTQYLSRNCHISLPELREQVAKNPQEASSIVRSFITGFSKDVNVSWDLVASRFINEIL